MTRRSTRFRYSVLFLLPALTIYLFFHVGPAVSGFYYSFTNWTSLNSGNVCFVGLLQFKRVFQLDYLDLALFNTLLFTVSTTIFKLLFGLILAVGLNRAIRSRNI